MGQRRSQVVGDVVRDLPQPLHQELNAVQHGVGVGGEAVEFVPRTDQRHTPAEVALHDTSRDAVDRLHPAQRAEAGDDPADDREKQGECRRDAEAADDLLLEMDHVAEVTRDRDELSRRQPLAEGFERMRSSAGRCGTRVSGMSCQPSRTLPAGRAPARRWPSASSNRYRKLSSPLARVLASRVPTNWSRPSVARSSTRGASSAEIEARSCMRAYSARLR